jgi:hypothetical protein
MIILDFIAFAFLVFVMFIPALVARQRRLKHKVACFWINLVLGWTLIVWFPLLCWSLFSNKVE